MPIAHAATLARLPLDAIMTTNTPAVLDMKQTAIVPCRILACRKPQLLSLFELYRMRWMIICLYYLSSPSYSFLVFP
jgi:hypothetical protein